MPCSNKKKFYVEFIADQSQLSEEQPEVIDRKILHLKGYKDTDLEELSECLANSKFTKIETDKPFIKFQSGSYEIADQDCENLVDVMLVLLDLGFCKAPNVNTVI